MPKSVLIDECLPTALHRAFPAHDVSTVARMGWLGTPDTALIDLADGIFDVVLTADRSMQFQQRLDARSFGLVIVWTTVLTDLLSAVAEMDAAIVASTPGTTIVIARPPMR